MENQVKKLKLNVNNIKSDLLDSNKKLRSLKIKKRDLISGISNKQKISKEENRLESNKFKSGASKIVNAVKAPVKSIFDKILEFFGLIALGILIQKLPEILEKIDNFMDSDFMKGVTNILTIIGDGFTELGKLVGIIPESKQKEILQNFKDLEKDIDGDKLNFDNFEKDSKLLEGETQNLENEVDKKLKESDKSEPEEQNNSESSGSADTTNEDSNNNDSGDIGVTPISSEQDVPSPNITPGANSPDPVASKGSDGDKPQGLSAGGTVAPNGSKTQKGDQQIYQPNIKESPQLKTAKVDTSDAFKTFPKVVDNMSNNLEIEKENIKKLAETAKNYTMAGIGTSRNSLLTRPITSPTSPGSTSPVNLPQGVEPGNEVIGFLGSTGNSTGPHIHIQQEGIPFGQWYSIPDSIKKGILIDGVDMITALHGPEDGNNGIGTYDWRRSARNPDGWHHGEDYGDFSTGAAISLKQGYKFIKFVPADGGGYGNRVFIRAPNGNVYSLNHLDSGPRNPQRLEELYRQQRRQQTPNNGGRLLSNHSSLKSNNSANDTVLIYAVQPKIQYIPITQYVPYAISEKKSSSNSRLAGVWRS